MSVSRAIVYIDGFNFYFGLRDRGWKKYYWLNIQKLCESIMPTNRDLVQVKYFTSRVSAKPHDPYQGHRQSKFIDAIYTLEKVRIIPGKFLSEDIECQHCRRIWQKENEKMTDVNIAVEIMVDAFKDNFDVAYVVSADSDLVPPIQKVLELFPEKGVISVFPPDRVSSELKKAASDHMFFNEQHFRDSLLPDKVRSAVGYQIEKPPEWS